MNFIDDLNQFLSKMGYIIPNGPTDLSRTHKELRDALLKEEILEYLGAEDKEEEFDALIDIIYVAVGTCVLTGYDLEEGWRRVHEANMMKERVSTVSESKRGSIMDVKKPKGWKKPDLRDLVCRNYPE